MGLYSLSLTVGAVNGLILAALIAFSPGRRDAGRWLAALIVLVALRLGPFILGYAGMYDRHRWLTFAPFDLSWAYGPLLWSYVVVLTTGQRPPRLWLHLAPAALQLSYWLVCFALPAEAKWAWYTGPHLGLIAPLGALIGLAQAGAYLAASGLAVGRYRRWLDGRYANREEARLTLPLVLLAAFGLTWLVAAGFAVTSWLVTPLDYFSRFPLMLTFVGLTYALGLIGWRGAGIDYPPMRAPEPPESLPDRPGYREQAEAFRQRLAASDWWRDETLDLAGLASRLAVSPRTLSRVLAEGARENFRTFIGRVRVDAVARSLMSSDQDILGLALDAGFSSKAAFNRAFRLYRGTTPSEFRRRAGLEIRQSSAEADSAAQ